MSKIKIEDYRGFEITFNTDKETFTAWNDFYDNEFSKKSFSAIKKGVDDYIKKNLGFIPFEIVKCYDYSGKLSRLECTLKITGIRKDGRLVYIGEDGKKKQLSDYDTKDYALLFEGFTKFNEQYKALKQQQEEVRLKFKASFNNLFKEIEESATLIPLSEKIKQLKELL